MVLLWLLPPVVVTVTAMVWVSWLGREHHGEIDREEALRRLGVALGDRRSWWQWRSRERRSPGYAVQRREPVHSSGVVVRRSTQSPPAAPGHPNRAPLPAAGDERRAS